MSERPVELDDLDRKLADLLPNMIVRKDLLRRMRTDYPVPMFVIEFLLGKYCASTDPDVIEEGLEFVRQSLADKYVKPDERERVKAQIKSTGSLQIVDKVSVVLKETQDKFWARLGNIDLDHVNIADTDIHRHERLLTGGIWAEVELGYDESYMFGGVTRPFHISRLTPIQLSNRDMTPFLEARKGLSRDEWMDLLLRSLGLEPMHPYFTQRKKLLYLCRLIPLVERNYNMIELGPRGTGKSFVFQQVSPYSHLISGGQTTVAQMFVHLGTGRRGLVCLWDVVCFDEAAGVRFPDKNGINIMKGYMEDGMFSRGTEVISAEGSIVFVGNIDGDIETISRTSNLFYELPREMDSAFYDRIHSFLPGWEFDKTQDEYYTDHFGLVSDFLAEMFTQLRKTSYGDYAERFFRLGSHLQGRDQKAVRKTVSGLMKLLHPHGEASKDELEEYIGLAMEMRRRVKEQLKKIGGLEYWDVNFSYTDKDNDQETFVPLPEGGEGGLIMAESLPPGSVYTVGWDAAEKKLALFLIQTAANPGSGRTIPLGALSRPMKEAIKTAEAYLRANLSNLGIDRDMKAYDFNIQAVNLSQAKEGSETAVAFFISLVSALLDRKIRPQTVVMGEMSVQGILLKVGNFTQRLELALDAGAKTIIVPSVNKRDLADVPDEILNKIQSIFYTDPLNAAVRALAE